MEGTYKVLYSTQAHSNSGPIFVSHERVLQKGIGTHGLTSGIIMQLLAENSKEVWKEELQIKVISRMDEERRTR